MLSWNNVDEYKLMARIGNGSSGQVYHVRRNKADYAMKQFFVASFNDHPLVDSLPEAAAIRTWSSSNTAETPKKPSEHPYLISLLDVSADKRAIGLVFPLAERSLEDWINQRRYNLDYRMMTKFAAQICRGIATLHNLGIIHSDIKPTNVVIHNGTAKLCDFGNAYSLFADEMLCQGTTWYMAPEAYNGVGSYPVDVWALGCLLYKMYTGDSLIKPEARSQYPRWLAMTIPKCSVKILSWMEIPDDEHNLLMALNRNVTTRFTRISDLDDLLEQIFQWYPANRPNIFEILQRGMFKNVLDQPFEFSRKSSREILDTHYDDSWRHVSSCLSSENKELLLNWKNGVLLNIPTVFASFLTILGRQMAKHSKESGESVELTCSSGPSEPNQSNELSESNQANELSGLSESGKPKQSNQSGEPNDRLTMLAALLIAYEVNFVIPNLPVEPGEWEAIYATERAICKDQDMCFHFSTPVRYCSLMEQYYDYKVVNKAKRYVAIAMLSGLAYDQPMLLVEAAMMLVGQRYGFFTTFPQTEAHRQLYRQFDELVTPGLNSASSTG